MAGMIHLIRLCKIMNSRLVINTFGKEGCLLTSCFRHKMHEKHNYDTPISGRYCRWTLEKKEPDVQKGSLTTYQYDYDL